MELGQRYSVMVKLNRSPRDYYLRFATFPSGDMQQVLEGRAIVSYDVSVLVSNDSRGLQNRAKTRVTRMATTLRWTSWKTQSAVGCT